ncbi:MAG: hypothetical protein JXR77_15985, partial [Lentisphaeria bacterium]|nr:hypothetical protein [Lentisphaeria bacterium]
CTSNHKQLCLAMIMYMGDNDQTISHCFRPPNEPDDANRWSWRAIVFPYVNDKKMYVCPSAPDWKYNAANAGTTVPGEAARDAGISMANVHSAAGAPIHPSGQPDAKVKTPARMILLGDHGPAADIPGNSIDNNTGFIRGINPPNTTHYGKATRHNMGCNYAFADGHAIWSKPENIPCKQSECWWVIEGKHP